ncbi:hypothetical protein [Kutzneria chonburiensis]|uniref:Uncharacterized protein n=1 Tax=Kutzneria chonburiensis TaxID=1483604 RepID=A0ABV6MZ25_9PSEU|nr:hypothetical protein [Kutzneria chonburiensis]
MRTVVQALAIVPVLAAALALGSLLGNGAAPARSSDIARCIRGLPAGHKAHQAVAACVQSSPVIRKPRH